MPGYRKLGRTSAQRKAMLRNLVTELFKNERISTTQTRAKEASREAEKMITLAKEEIFMQGVRCCLMFMMKMLSQNCLMT